MAPSTRPSSSTVGAGSSRPGGQLPPSAHAVRSGRSATSRIKVVVGGGLVEVVVVDVLGARDSGGGAGDRDVAGALAAAAGVDFPLTSTCPSAMTSWPGRRSRRGWPASNWPRRMDSSRMATSWAHAPAWHKAAPSGRARRRTTTGTVHHREWSGLLPDAKHGAAAGGQCAGGEAGRGRGEDGEGRERSAERARRGRNAAGK